MLVTLRRLRTIGAKTIERCGEKRVGQQIKHLLFGLFGSKTVRRTQRLNGLAPAAQAHLRASQIEIGLSKVRIFGGCSLKIWDCFLKSALIEKRQSCIKACLSLAKQRQRRACGEC